MKDYPHPKRYHQEAIQRAAERYVEGLQRAGLTHRATAASRSQPRI